MMETLDTRQIRKIVDEIEATLLEVEQYKVMILLLADEVESRALRGAILAVADEIVASLHRMRTSCHELRSAHSVPTYYRVALSPKADNEQGR